MSVTDIIDKNPGFDIHEKTFIHTVVKEIINGIEVKEIVRDTQSIKIISIVRPIVMVRDIGYYKEEKRVWIGAKVLVRGS